MDTRKTIYVLNFLSYDGENTWTNPIYASFNKEKLEIYKEHLVSMSAKLREELKVHFEERAKELDPIQFKLRSLYNVRGKKKYTGKAIENKEYKSVLAKVTKLVQKYQEKKEKILEKYKFDRENLITDPDDEAYEIDDIPILGEDDEEI